MTNPQTETKIERVTEAAESLTVAVISAQGTSGDSALRAFDRVKDAREEYKAALRELIAPTLRVVGDQGRITRNADGSAS
jgi:hypothetical protein